MEKLGGTNSTEPLQNLTADQWLVNERGSLQHLTPGGLRVLLPTVLGVVCVLGVACNLPAVASLFSNAHRGKLSLINSLIFNLMLADGLVLMFVMPFRAVFYSRSSWDLGWATCKTADWFLQSCMAAKSFTVAVMAKACYHYVSNPTKQVSIHLGSILVVLLFIWVSACTVTVPHWLFASLQRGTRGVACVLLVPPEARDFMSVYVKAYPLTVYCAPLSVALVYFWKAYGQCQRRSSKTQNLRTQIRSRRLTLMLFSLTVAMAALWLPQWVVWLWEWHVAEKQGEGAQPLPSSPPVLLVLSAHLLSFSMSLVNPLVVLSLSEEFREGYRGLWRRLTLRKQPPAQPKPGPHNPTVVRSPSPRPETSGEPRGQRYVQSGFSRDLGPEGQYRPEQGVGREGGDIDRVSLKDGIVLSDVEQFWHERETGSKKWENDPVPWEQESREV